LISWMHPSSNPKPVFPSMTFRDPPSLYTFASMAQEGMAAVLRAPNQLC
jgi:hypothetical protein